MFTIQSCGRSTYVIVSQNHMEQLFYVKLEQLILENC